MKTKKHTFFGNSVDKFFAVIPVECPHCGAYNTPHTNHFSKFSVGTNKIYTIELVHDCCDESSIALYKVNGEHGEFLGILPSVHKIPELPDSVKNISPRFVNLYNQSFDAEQNDYLELAGSGYRNALEILIKDYAIEELSHAEEEVCKKSLYQSIKDYLPDIDLSVSADVIRVLGNDYTHYERKYEEIDFEILKRYIQIFIQSIDCKYLISHPVVPINPDLIEDKG